MSTDTITIAVIGCGQRGKAYSRYALSNASACKIVAIAEPRRPTRAAFALAHAVDKSLIFEDWKDFWQASEDTIATLGKRLADAVLVTVQDAMHMEVTKAFAQQGYHILCEKPMATSIDDIMQMQKAIKEKGIIFGMGHVLRYSGFNQEITKIVRSGELGELVNIVHVEPVGHWHFAHSYVRGNWSKESTSSFSLLTKSCHDIDIICSWLAPAVPTRVSSFGSLKHFNKSAKPPAAGGATRCWDCKIETECPYSATRVYLESFKNGNKGWPVSVIVDSVPDIENVTDALKNGPYGRCVYESDNDVCDNQVVNIEFSTGATASFTMIAQTALICERQTRLHFTHGDIIADASTSSFTLNDFRTRTQRTISTKPTDLEKASAEDGGHGGGDIGLIKAFVDAVREGRQGVLGTDVDEVVRSHLCVFAAERSRREGRVVDCVEFEREARGEVGV